MNEETEFSRIAKISIVSPYGLWVEWSDGTTSEVDLEGTIYGFGPYEPLRDPDTFAKASVMDWGDGIAWPNGLDMSADTLAFLARAQREMTPSELKEWQQKLGLSNQEAADWANVALSTWKTYIGKNGKVPRPLQIAATAALENPAIFYAHYKPRHVGRSQPTKTDSVE
jgi:hypothetical protein